MTRARGWVLLLAAAILGAAFVAWHSPSDSVPPAAGARSEESMPTTATPRVPTTSPAPAVVAALPVTTTAAAPQAATAALAYLAARYAPERTAAFDRFSASKDPAELAAAADIADECAVFSDHLFEQTLANIEKGGMAARIKAQQRETVELERTRCAGFDAERLARGARIRRALAKEGDIRMFAWSMPQGGQPIPEVVAIAQRAAGSGDPLAILQVGNFFANRNDIAPGIEYDLGDGLAVPRNVLRDAFSLAACDFGVDCGARSGYVANRCVGAGYCGSASLDDLFRHYSYSPAEAARLEAARQVVLTGLRTGQWPTNFWNPPK